MEKEITIEEIMDGLKKLHPLYFDFSSPLPEVTIKETIESLNDIYPIYLSNIIVSYKKNIKVV